MRQLKAHGRKHGVAVVCSIHQPSSQIGALFDTALLLVPGGKDVYLGPAQQLRPHLSAHGYELPSDYTTWDFAMELLASHEHADNLASIWQAERGRISAERAALARPAAARVGARAPAAGFVEQTTVLMHRQLRQSRGTLLAKNEVLLSVMVALISGLLFFKAAQPSAQGEPPSERALLGFVFYCLAHMSWWPMYLYLFRCARLRLRDSLRASPAAACSPPQRTAPLCRRSLCAL